MDYYNKYYEGIFWLPEKEGNKIIATLFIDEKGFATISSLQTFTDDPLLERNTKFDIVLGHISCNEKSRSHSIKLYDVFVTSSTITFLNKKKYTSHNLFISPPDKDVCQLSYKALLLGSSYLNEYVDYKGLEYNYTGDEKDFGTELAYNQPKEIELFSNNDYQIYLYARAFVSPSDRGRSINISENIFLNIKTNKNHSAKELIYLKQSIVRLFALLWNQSPKFVDTELKSVSGKFYKQLNDEVEKENPFLNFESVEFEKFKGNSNTIFDNWFSKQDELKLVLNNFFSVYKQKGVLVENRFLTYISVIENYHKNNIAKGSHLKKRLKDILEKSNLASIIDDIDIYSELLKDTRNYHAHLDEEQEEKSLSIDDIIKANAVLEVAIRELLLRKIGLEIPKSSYDSIKIETVKYLK